MLSLHINIEYFWWFLYTIIFEIFEEASLSYSKEYEI